MGQWGILWGNGGSYGVIREFYGVMGDGIGDPMGEWGILWGNMGTLWAKGGF